MKLFRNIGIIAIVMFSFFYTEKIASMWTENTYAAVRNNTTQENDPLENMIGPLTFYQKALLILTCLCSLIVLIKNRKNLSLDLTSTLSFYKRKIFVFDFFQNIFGSLC